MVTKLIDIIYIQSDKCWMRPLILRRTPERSKNTTTLTIAKPLVLHKRILNYRCSLSYLTEIETRGQLLNRNGYVCLVLTIQAAYQHSCSVEDVDMHRLRLVLQGHVQQIPDRMLQLVCRIVSRLTHKVYAANCP